MTAVLIGFSSPEIDESSIARGESERFKWICTRIAPGDTAFTTTTWKTFVRVLSGLVTTTLSSCRASIPSRKITRFTELGGLRPVSPTKLYRVGDIAAIISPVLKYVRRNKISPTCKIRVTFSRDRRTCRTLTLVRPSLDSLKGCPEL